ncbi:6658_t:CDS:10 [Entrophospora sp. SA101]|nr:6658_t:CDS:10 [Entrophospora sp. SA101]
MSYKIVILGDTDIEKTYHPTIEDSYRKQVEIDNQPCGLDVLETAGQGEHIPLWDQWIRDGKGFLLVYSISSHPTFEQVEMFKDQIIGVKGSNKIPLILVGNKCDRHTEYEVLSEEGMNMTKRLGCELVESSVKTFVNVNTVVEMIEQSRQKKLKITKNFKLLLKSLKLQLKSLKLLLKMNVEHISEEEKWFKNQLKRECILFLDYNSFRNIKIIDGGSFGTISCAYSKHHQGLVALKSINIDQKYTFEQFLNEAKQHLKVEHHSNILRFYGITKENSYRKQVEIDNQPCGLDVLETAGQGEHIPLWDQWIRDGKGFLLVYSISSHPTFEQVEMFKDQIIGVKGSNKIPLILVGNKCDRHTEYEVLSEEGMNMTKRLGCELVESSVKTFVNVNTVVEMIEQSRQKKLKITKNFKLLLKSLKLQLKSLKLLLKMNVEHISEEEKWFKNQLKRECILFLDYNSFRNIKIIDGGSFGTISCAYSKHHQGLVALKSINIDQKYTFEQFLNEAKQHLKVEHHSNILRFYGITKES